jgi:hypothetical protein
VRSDESYDELDVVEVVVLNILLSTLRKKHVRAAWQDVRPRLRTALPGAHLWVVWDPQRLEAELASDDAGVARLVRHGRPVQVIDVAPAVEEARGAFRREITRSSSMETASKESRQPRRGTG